LLSAVWLFAFERGFPKTRICPQQDKFLLPSHLKKNNHLAQRCVGGQIA
jgi:hypothetical protein